MVDKFVALSCCDLASSAASPPGHGNGNADAASLFTRNQDCQYFFIIHLFSIGFKLCGSNYSLDSNY